jgi:hypothetical protein
MAVTTAASEVASGAPEGPWTVEASTAPGATSQLSGVSAVPGASWAVGSSLVAGRQRALVLKRRGSAWSPQTIPHAKGNNELLAVKATSGSNAWAVGDHSGANGMGVLILHWNGSAWSIQSAPRDGFSACGSAPCSYGLEAIAALSKSNAWAVGSHACFAIECHELTLVEHWDGHSWKIQPSPNESELSELTSVTAWNNTHVWAAGTDRSGVVAGQATGFVERWAGSKWRLVHTPQPGFATELNGISAVSATNVWAVGGYTPSQHAEEKTLILHWNGSTWRRVTSPNVGSRRFNDLQAVKVISADNVWAVGSYVTKSPGVQQTLIEHYDGRSWSIVASPNAGTFDNALSAIAGVSSTRLFAVGVSSQDTDGTATSPLVLHCC